MDNEPDVIDKLHDIEAAISGASERLDKLLSTVQFIGITLALIILLSLCALLKFC